MKIDKINFPVHNSKSNIERIKVAERIIKALHHSNAIWIVLIKVSEGKYQYDSILQASAGLVDSVWVLEQLYLSQQNH